jgi:hypothetical protein
MLATGKPPGIIEDILEAPDIATIIVKCWSFDPAIRPTAASVSNALLSNIEKLSLPKEPNLNYGQQPAPDSGSHALNVSDFETCAIGAIKIARQINDKSATFRQSSSIVDSGEFKTLLDSDDLSDPVSAFIIGAVLFWNLCESFPEMETGHALALFHDEEGKRILKFSWMNHKPIPHRESCFSGGILSGICSKWWVR